MIKTLGVRLSLSKLVSY